MWISRFSRLRDDVDAAERQAIRGRGELCSSVVTTGGTHRSGDEHIDAFLIGPGETRRGPLHLAEGACSLR